MAGCCRRRTGVLNSETRRSVAPSGRGGKGRVALDGAGLSSVRRVLGAASEDAKNSWREVVGECERGMGGEMEKAERG